MGENLKPVFGINLGSLGFLTCVPSSAVEQAVECIVSRRYVLTRRVLLEMRGAAGGHDDRPPLRAERCRHQPRRPLAAHPPADVHRWRRADRIQRGWPGHLDPHRLHRLLAGGGRADPDAGQRRLRRHAHLPARAHESLAHLRGSIDHRRHPLRRARARFTSRWMGSKPSSSAEGDTVHIRKAPQCVSLAVLPGVSFFEVLRQKLKWGGAAI